MTTSIRPKASVFLKAAKSVFNSISGKGYTSLACNAIKEVCGVHDYGYFTSSASETNAVANLRYFNSLYKEDARIYRGFDFYPGFYWPTLSNGDHDYESRILALLLCYQILRSQHR